ncbi:MAG: hypothetical protein H0X04_02285 [Chthoniobacterales bacterium]|nr:hypothetical protein [Chthoniobacterales bacterium]
MLRIAVGGDNNSVAGDLNVERKQCATTAGTTGAFTGFRFVKGAVGPADQKAALVVEDSLGHQSSGVPAWMQ